MREIHASPGEPVTKAAERLAAAAPAFMEFNGVRVEAMPGATPDELVASWSAKMEAKAAAYWESPEGKALKAEQEDRRARIQSKADALMTALPRLDFTNDVAVLNWLCEMQEPSDHIGVIVPRTKIILEFKKRGYMPNVNCGQDFRPDDRENVFRWLVGQALDGLNGPAIHGIIHKFAADWKAKFSQPASSIH
jgi:hypothetical protein